MVKVVMMTQSHSSKQGQLIRWPKSALIMSLNGWCCGLADITSGLSGTVRLLPFPCTDAPQNSPAPCSLCLFTFLIHLVEELWLSIP